MKINNLSQYYFDEHKDKIFRTRLCVEGKCFDILYNYDKKDEIQKFLTNFTEYLPYYVSNSDLLEAADFKDNIGAKLSELSKRYWGGPNIPDRDYKMNGIFGELFLDFYERIVKNSKLACTYVSRRNFNSDGESTGFDNVLFRVTNDGVEPVFAEAKFVATKSSAKSALIEDIKGKPAKGNQKEKIGHLTFNFLNDYITFVVEKQAFFSDEDKNILKPFFSKLNNVLMNGDGNFISFLIENDICVNCVFFAIFTDPHTSPMDYINAYDEIETEAKQHLEKMGFHNYNIEIVFIPTFSDSVDIKRAIDEFYK